MSRFSDYHDLTRNTMRRLAQLRGIANDHRYAPPAGHSACMRTAEAPRPQ